MPKLLSIVLPSITVGKIDFGSTLRGVIGGGGGGGGEDQINLTSILF